MKPTLFAICGEGPLFPGLWTGETWNGWAVPLFPAETCIRIALEMLDDSGQPIFSFNEHRQVWRQRAPLDCPDEGPWVEPAVMVDGVPHWKMGDGYMWEKVSLSGEWSNYRADGVEIPADKIPLNAQAAILTEVWEGAASGSVTVDGITYQWD